MTAGRTLAYGLLGLPLAFAALPIYVHVPRFYAEVAGLELALLGAILLGTRLLDAGIDPWLGWLADRVPRPTMVALALVPFAAGFGAKRGGENAVAQEEEEDEADDSDRASAWLGMIAHALLSWKADWFRESWA